MCRNRFWLTHSVTVYIFSLIFMVVCVGLQAKPAKAAPAFWGGVSIEESSISLAPVAVALMSGANGELDIQARLRIRDKPYKNLEFIVDSRISSQTVQAVIVTASVARESLEVFQDLQASTPTYYHTYRVFLNLMAFDWDGVGQMGRYIASVPLVMDYLDAKDRPASKEEQKATFAAMYLNNSLSGLNVFDELYKASSHLDIDGYSEKFPQVAQFIFDPDALALLGDEFDPVSSAHMLRQFFEAQLAKSSGAVLVPAMSEKRANQEFKFVFSDRSQNIVFPDPLGQIVVKIDRLIPFSKTNNVQKTLCFSSVLKVFVYDEFIAFSDDPGKLPTLAEDEKPMMQRKFARTGDSCFVTHKDNSVNQNRYFMKSILMLLKDTAAQFGDQVDSGWLKNMGVPSEMISLYQKEISEVKEELLVSYR